MDKPTGLGESGFEESLSIGQVVLSRQGKDRGAFYVVVGFPERDRLALADGGKFNVSRPKKKNPRHIQRTSWFAAELLEKGRDIDRGRFCQVLRECAKLKFGTEAVHG